MRSSNWAGAFSLATFVWPAALFGQPLARVGVEFQVNTHTTLGQLQPAITSDAADGYLVIWQSEGQDGFGGPGIFGRCLDSAGAPKGVEFQVNRYTSGQQSYPDVASDGDGDFIVVWQSYGQDGNDNGVFGRRFGSNGVPLTGEFQINSYTSGYQGVSRVAA